MVDVVTLTPTKSDYDLAQEHRKLIMEASEPLMVALTRAKKDGFVAQLNFGEDAFHRVVIQGFNLFKQF